MIILLIFQFWYTHVSGKQANRGWPTPFDMSCSFAEDRPQFPQGFRCYIVTSLFCVWWYSLGWPSVRHLSFQESTKQRRVKEVIWHLCGKSHPSPHLHRTGMHILKLCILNFSLSLFRNTAYLCFCRTSVKFTGVIFIVNVSWFDGLRIRLHW